MIYWLYRNRETNLVVWSHKIMTEMGGSKKWSLIGDYSTRSKTFTSYEY